MLDCYYLKLGMETLGCLEVLLNDVGLFIEVGMGYLEVG